MVIAGFAFVTISTLENVAVHAMKIKMLKFYCSWLKSELIHLCSGIFSLLLSYITLPGLMFPFNELNFHSYSSVNNPLCNNHIRKSQYKISDIYEMFR